MTSIHNLCCYSYYCYQYCYNVIINVVVVIIVIAVVVVFVVINLHYYYLLCFDPRVIVSSL